MLVLTIIRGFYVHVSSPLSNSKFLSNVSDPYDLCSCHSTRIMFSRWQLLMYFLNICSSPLQRSPLLLLKILLVTLLIYIINKGGKGSLSGIHKLPPEEQCSIILP